MNYFLFNDKMLLNLVLAALCILLVLGVVTAIAAFLFIRRLQRYLSADVAQLNQRFDQLSSANPTLNSEIIIQKIIRQQAFKCGLVGAITGIGGFLTLPIALPINILWAMRLQAILVQFIATRYHANVNPQQQKLQTALVMTGSIEVSRTTTSLIMRFIVRFVSESLSIFIPALGAIVGFVVNYGIAQATGNAALYWYSTHDGSALSVES